jgi:hypothetical protein
MLKASALYMVIVISLVIALLCSSLISVAYFYRLQYQKTFRYEKLQNNLQSGINILLASEDGDYPNASSFSLFNTNADSVSLQKIHWGIFNVGIAKAFIQKDTINKIFSIANIIDSTKWAVLYMSDNKRSLNLSGKTSITGDAYIPKAGVKPAYVDGKAYNGDRRFIIGHIHNSAKTLPSMLVSRLSYIQGLFISSQTALSALPVIDSVGNSFLSPTLTYNFGKKVFTLNHVKLNGNIIIHSDTTLILDSTAKLNGPIVIARSIVVKEGFAGKCQLFAADSIGVGQNCLFNYPSCLAVISHNAKLVNSPALINIGDNSIVNGLAFIDQQTQSTMQPIIQLGKKTIVRGQIYVDGLLAYKEGAEIDGSVFVNRFFYKTAVTSYENYLVNVTLNEQLLSHYYLTSELMPVCKNKKRILEWLE